MSQASPWGSCTTTTIWVPPLCCAVRSSAVSPAATRLGCGGTQEIRGLLLLRGMAFNAVPRFRERFTVAVGATARACESAAVAEDEAAILALGGFQDEAQRAISRHGFDDVIEMVLDLSLRNPDDLGE